MDTRDRWPRILCILGLIAMLTGCLDPLEGSVIILPGSGMVAAGAFMGASRRRKLAYWAFGATAVGVGILFGLSSLGGVGGETGRSMWWLLVVLPYPVGVILALISGLLITVELSRRQ
jgi:hypothetical protein